MDVTPSVGCYTNSGDELMLVFIGRLMEVLSVFDSVANGLVCCVGEEEILDGFRPTYNATAAAITRRRAVMLCGALCQ